jgi:uncharacterized protein (DUF302 family)
MGLIIGLTIGVAIGVLISWLLIVARAQGLMLHENVSLYGFEETEEKITKAAAELGWKIPKVHDLQETMTNNGYSVSPVKVMEICKPAFAYQILERGEERIASSLMPCRIALYEKPDGKIYVSRMNSSLIGGLMKGVIPSMMTKAAREMEIILQSVLKQ